MIKSLSKTARLVLAVLTLTMASSMLFAPAVSAGTNSDGSGNEVDIDPPPAPDTDHRTSCSWDWGSLSYLCNTYEVTLSPSGNFICLSTQYYNERLGYTWGHHMLSERCIERGAQSSDLVG